MGIFENVLQHARKIYGLKNRSDLNSFFHPLSDVGNASKIFGLYIRLDLLDCTTMLSELDGIYPMAFYSGPEGVRVKVSPRSVFFSYYCVLNFLNFARLQSLNSD